MSAAIWDGSKTQCLQQFIYLLVGAVAKAAFIGDQFARFKSYTRTDVGSCQASCRMSVFNQAAF